MAETQVKVEQARERRQNVRESLYAQTSMRNQIIFRWDRFANSPKRKSGTKNFLVSVFAIVASLFVSLFIAMAVYGDGTLFYRVLEQIFTAPFGADTWKSTISMVAIFAVSALSFIFAQKVGLFNLGISGQMLFGAQLATLMCWYIPTIPNVLGQLLVIIVSMVGGAIVATLVGILKVFLNINEVISSIMFNWIIYYCGSYMLNKVGTDLGTWSAGEKAGQALIDSGGINTNILPSNMLISIQGNSVASGSWLPLLIIMVLLVVISVTVLSFSVFGKKIASVGFSGSASQYAGINVKKKQIVTMLISGLIAGMLGAMIYCGYEGLIPVTISAKAIPQYGFNGISVGLIAMVNPIGVVPVSLLFSMIDTSKASITAFCGVDPNIGQLMFGVIVYGAAIIAAFYYFTPWIWIKQLFYGKTAKKAYQEYNEDIRIHLSNCNNTIASVTQLRKEKRNILRLRWKSSKLVNKIKTNLYKVPYLKKNKYHYDSLDEFMRYCQTYEHTYIGVLAGFADMHGRVPRYLKSQFNKAIKQHVYEKYGFKWRLLDKHATVIHCLACQRMYLSEIFNSQSVKDNFAIFGIDPNKLNKKEHIKLIKQRICRYYVIYKKIAKNKFNYVVIQHRKNKYNYKHCKYLYVNNIDSTMTNEIAASLKHFGNEVKNFTDYNMAIDIVRLKFAMRDSKHSKYLVTGHDLKVKTKIEGLTEARNISHLITDTLSVEVMNKTNFLKTKAEVKDHCGKKGPCHSVYLTDPQLFTKDYYHSSPTKVVENEHKMKDIKLTLYGKLKKMIMRKQSYELIEQILITKRELLECQADYVNLYSLPAVMHFTRMYASLPVDKRKEAK